MDPGDCLLGPFFIMCWLEIQKTTRRSHGIVLTPHGPVLVPGVLPGEWVKIHRYSREFRPDIGRIIALKNESIFRIQSTCKYFPSCPGCHFRHIAIDRQRQSVLLDIKKNWLFERHNLSHCIAVSGVTAEAYRLRTALRPFNVKGQLVLGMASWFPCEPPAPLKECGNHSDTLNSLIELIEVSFRQLDLERVLSLVHKIDIHLSSNGVHRICITSVGKRRPTEASLKILWEVLEPYPLTILHKHLPTEKTRAQYQLPQVIVGNGNIEFRVRNQKLTILPTVWTPVSMGSTEMLLRWIEEAMDSQTYSRILELGCGAGLISGSISTRCSEFLGIDINRWAIESARKNFKSLSAGKATFRCGDATRLTRKLVREKERFDCVIVHGMRHPFGDDLYSYIRMLGPDMIILISPSTGSWLKDAESLNKMNWNPVNVVVHDQIPHTSGFLIAGVFGKESEQG